MALMLKKDPLNMLRLDSKSIIGIAEKLDSPPKA